MVLSRPIRRWAVPASLFALALSLTACGGGTPTSQAPTSGGSMSPAAGGATVAIKGAGSTAGAPIYQKWFAEFGNTNPSVQFGYESIGSGAGIKQFLAETVDFGATDAPLKDEDRAKVPAKRGKAIQVPSTGIFVVMTYNLDGVDNLKLSREALCGITDGSIKTWNDPKIAKDNPGVNLPAEPIAFVHRSDGSGTTSIYTSHIVKACPDWKAGKGTSIEWPTGTGGKGNEGVAAQVQQTKGSIGYVEYAYAKQNNMKMAALQNKAGEFIVPTPDAAAKALAGAPVPEDFAVSVPDPEAKDAYPIVSLTWLLFYSNYPDAAKVDALKSFMKWAMKDGKTAAAELGYIPLPDDLGAKVVTAVDAIKAGK